MRIEIGKRYRFNYPENFVTLPEYSKHRGAVVTVLRELEDGVEYDNEGERMFQIETLANGYAWLGHAWESELEEINVP